MESGRQYLSLLLVTVCVSTCIALAITCERPTDPRLCEGIVADCWPLTREGCAQAGGEWVPRGNACDFCERCGRYVDRGMPCNISEEYRGYDQERMFVTSLCSSPLVCSRRYNGTCVDPALCVYEDP